MGSDNMDPDNMDPDNDNGHARVIADFFWVESMQDYMFWVYDPDHRTQGVFTALTYQELRDGRMSGEGKDNYIDFSPYEWNTTVWAECTTNS